MFPKLFSAALAAGVAMALAPAHADQVEFDYKTHELETSGGAKALYSRLSKEAKNLCRHGGKRSLTQQRVESECALRLADEWVAKIDSPRVDRIHASARGNYDVAGRR